jgi:capsular exopolysaccharide synthesis family protein
MRLLRRRWPLIAMCCVLGLSAALAFSFSQQKQYTGAASLLFRDPNLDQRLFGSQVLTPSSDPTREADTNLRLVSLGTVAELTGKDLHLPPATIAAAVTIGTEGQSNVVSVQATDPSPQRAAQIANAYAREFIAFRRRADQSKIEGAEQLVERQLAVMTPDQRSSAEGRSLKDRSEQLKILAKLQTGNAELVQLASAPGSPSSPRIKRSGILGALLGILLGIVIAMILDRLDRRIRDLQEAEDIFQLPLLAVVPDSRSFLYRGEGGLMVPPHADLDVFRLLRARLRYFNIDRNIRSVVVTSAVPSEGKSTIAWHLALAAAASGDAKVLLIEADLRRPTLAGHSGIRAMPGLSELLTHELPLDEVVQHVGTDPNHEDGPVLDVIPAGLVPPNPSALIESHRMSDLLEVLFRVYDFVVIDTPPSSVVSDAMPLVPQVDGVVVVSRLGRTTRDAALRLRGELEELRAPLLGFVINGVRGPEGGYYGYGYGYGYGPSLEAGMAVEATNGDASGNGEPAVAGSAAGSSGRAGGRSLLRRKK